MPINTPLNAPLGIRHPILLAPMDVVAGARLTLAVSNAGGFGVLGGGYGEKAWLEQETGSLKQQARAPFGIGFITWSLSRQPELLDIALGARPRAIMLSFGDPKPFASQIKAAGALLICQVQDEGMAQLALDSGADILVAQGTEAGGHGASRSTIDIVPAIVDLSAGRVPVVAAGGIADGRGLAAMITLGASGVLLGTRFYASQEAERRKPRSGSAPPRAAAPREVSSSTCHGTTSGRHRLPGAAWSTIMRGAGPAAKLSSCKMQRRSQPNMPRPRPPAISILRLSLPAKPLG